ncbi:MAG: polymer-forming cytoskeletal protein, partial [Sandaracinaceae bacterium]
MTRASSFPAGLRLDGAIECEGDLTIWGTVVGPVTVGGALAIEPDGRVEGDVRARAITVRGVLVGNAEGGETIRLDASATLVGDAVAPRVSIDEGAKIRGRVRMSGEPLVPDPVRRRRARDVGQLAVRPEVVAASYEPEEPPTERPPPMPVEMPVEMLDEEPSELAALRAETLRADTLR